MIYGERLRLRAIERDDLPHFVAWLNDPEVREHLLPGMPLSLASEEQWFEENLKKDRPEQALAIEIQQASGWRLIGNTSFMDIDTINRSAEIGIMIGDRSCWNQGYGREAMRTMLRYGFDTLNLHRIFLKVDATNPRGIRAYEHAGFQHEGCMRQAVYKNGQYIDVLLMSVIKDEMTRD